MNFRCRRVAKSPVEGGAHLERILGREPLVQHGRGCFRSVEVIDGVSGYGRATDCQNKRRSMSFHRIEFSLSCPSNLIASLTLFLRPLPMRDPPARAMIRG